VDRDQYCREIEAYLCRKNDGHLIRIVGPSFERVCSWAARGIPFKIACQGIDCCFIRYYAKGPKRRPVQIDFCEADVLDAFDAWRRAVGVRLPGQEHSEEDGAATRHRRGLGEHLDRVCERITVRRAALRPPPPEFDGVLERIASEASLFKQLPAPIRGEHRASVVARLAELDRLLLDAARGQSDAGTLQVLRQEAGEQLAPFRDRMPKESYERAIEAALDRLLREREQLPTVTFE
jgi:hypothetical protein